MTNLTTLDHHIFSPYCLCPLGAHIDHQQGPVTGLALDRGIDFRFSTTEDGLVNLRTSSYPNVLVTNVRIPVGRPLHDWSDYVRGVLWVMQKEFRLERGITGIIRGSLPSGGIGSSAALLCGFTSAVAFANGIRLTPQQMVDITSQAERKFVGLNNGVLDQSCVTMSQKNHLLYLDTATGEHRLIPFGGGEGREVPFKIAIFYSGATRTMLNTDYNLRVEECRAAAWMLQAYEGIRLNHLAGTYLRQVEPEVFERYEQQMPERFARRARHFFTESERVKMGIEAWEAGDIVTFGQLVFESCESSLNNYECGSIELKTIYESLRQAEGVYGARFCGAGFTGSCYALIDPALEGVVRERVASDYLSRFPRYRDSCRGFICQSDNNVRFV